MKDEVFHINGTNRARTYDPLLVRQMLSQLSYDPICAPNGTMHIILETLPFVKHEFSLIREIFDKTDTTLRSLTPHFG